MAYVPDRDVEHIRWPRERRLFPDSLARREKFQRKFRLQKKIGCAYAPAAGEMHVQTTNRRARRPGGWLTALPEDTVMHLPLSIKATASRKGFGLFELPAASRQACAIAMLLAAPLFAFAQSTTLPKAGPTPTAGPTQATIIPSGWSSVQFDGWYACGDQGKVLIGRHRSRGVIVWNTYYRCGTVMLNGNAVTLRNQINSPSFSEMNGQYFSRPNSVITTAYLQDSEQDTNAKLGSSELFNDKGEKLNVRFESSWRTIPNNQEPFDCPTNMAMVGRDSGRTRFLCATIWAGNPPPSTASGRITFRDAETKIPCSIAVPNGPTGEVWMNLFLAHDSPCANNSVESIALESVPSATRILLTDSDLCAKEDDFWIELRTTAKSVTSDEPLNLDEFFTYSPGSIVQPGVMLVGMHRKSASHAVKNLSCVQITTSSAPPSS